MMMGGLLGATAGMPLLQSFYNGRDVVVTIFFTGK